MRNLRRNFADGPSRIIRWQGARQVLDHAREHARQARDASPCAIKINKETRQ